MYLKSIEVQGFKSFAQKIHFEFHNGITGIVGPNGSGKSNVGDAVRWVLGEQSAKQLRGGNMQDVIFSGTELRKPLSYASVAITLDNADHALPVDYNEVTITRRLYRSGESEYLLNGTSCRLRDINEMFYDTGIGKEGYSIIGQGQIDKILSGKPEERRELFDEAAGIVKYKRRKNATVKKLQDEESNLLRVTDILSELTKQVGPLEKQAEAAKIYLSKREVLRELDVNLFLIEMKENLQEREKLSEEYQITDTQLQDVKSRYEKIKDEYERMQARLEELSQALEEWREKSTQNTILKGQYESSISLLKEQIQFARTTRAQMRERLEVITREKEERNRQLDVIRKTIAETRKELEGLAAEEHSCEAELEQVRGRGAEVHANVEEGKNEIMDILGKRANTEGSAQRSLAQLEQLKVQKASFASSLLRLRTDEAELNERRKQADAEYETVTARIAECNEETTRLEKRRMDIAQKQQKLRESLEKAQAAYHSETSRMESLRNLAERYDGYGNAIRRVMEQKNQNPGIKGVVADLITTEKKYETAIETALGGSIQNVVTDNEQTAKRMIEFLKKGKYGRATFLPMTAVKGSGGFHNPDALKEIGVLGVASELVVCEEAYKGIIRNLLGRTLVVDQLDHAIEIARKYRQTLRMVTLEGDMVSPGGSMSGGAYRNSSNLLGRRRELDELQEKVESLKSRTRTLATAVKENQNQREYISERIQNLQGRLRELYVSQNTALMKKNQIVSEEEALQNEEVRIHREQDDLKRKESLLQADAGTIQIRLQESRKDEKELSDYINVQQKELDEILEKENSLLRNLEQIRLSVQARNQQNEFNQVNMDRISAENRAFEEEESESSVKVREAGEQIEEKIAQIAELEGRIEDCAEVLESAGREIRILGEDREEVTRRSKSHMELREQLAEESGRLDKEVFRLTHLLEKLQAEEEARIEAMWTDYEITPVKAQEYRKEELKDPMQIRKDLGRVREEIRRLGNVNVGAIEQYKEVKERHTFLSAQYEDLTQAAQTLKGIIAELDEGMRRQFAEKFRDIQREFDKAFKELFGGGKGSLELSEDEDLLEAGIRIISQPPGKKLQNMMQLSGGEKALTAIALLFAIQNLKPSPFCLLDEIEAALDDSNVGRFAGYLQKLSRNTQFIVITHRRGTMTAADRLYGITMQEKGVSALVSVDLVEKDLTR